MFSSLKLFSHLPCPEKDSGRCPFVNCLFSHELIPDDVALCDEVSASSQKDAREVSLPDPSTSSKLPPREKEPDKTTSSDPRSKARAEPEKTTNSNNGAVVPNTSNSSDIQPETPFMGCLVKPAPSAHGSKKRPAQERQEEVNNTAHEATTTRQTSPSLDLTKKRRLDADPKTTISSQKAKTMAALGTSSQPFSTAVKSQPRSSLVLNSSSSSLSSSPPPAGLSRPLNIPTPPTTAPSSLSSSAATLASVAIKPSSQKQTSKPETLNPRLVTNDPVGHAQRYTYLIHLHKEMKRLNDEAAKRAAKDPRWKSFVLSPDQLITVALDEEQELVQTHGVLYPNMIRKRVFAIHKMSLQDWLKSRREKRREALATLKDATPSNATSQHSESTAKLKGQTSSTKDHTSGNHDVYQNYKVKTGLNADDEIHLLRHGLLSKLDTLTSYGYVQSPPTDEEIEAARKGVEASRGWEQCDRCTRRFEVFPARREDGALTSGGTCTYHWGRAMYQGGTGRRLGLESTQRFSCCQGELGSEGCCSHPTHVFKVTNVKRLASVLPFENTPENPKALISANRAIALDCEMAYSTLGMELIRVTVVSWPEGDQLVDFLVRPLGQLLDFNTRFSGIAPEQFVSARQVTVSEFLEERFGVEMEEGNGPKTDSSLDIRLAKPVPLPSSNQKDIPIIPSPHAARKLVFALINPETPIIGHGLENDLNALRIVHRVISDTVILFPHPRGLPFRRTLRSLAEEQLNWIIQRSSSAGQELRPAAPVCHSTPELPSMMKVKKVGKDNPDKTLDEKSDGGSTSAATGLINTIPAAASPGLVIGHDSLEDARAAGELVRKRIEGMWAHLKCKGWKIGPKGLEKPTSVVSALRQPAGSSAVRIKSAVGLSRSALLPLKKEKDAASKKE